MSRSALYAGVMETVAFNSWLSTCRGGAVVLLPGRSTTLRGVKLARTIAGLEGAPDIQTHHLAEAIQGRPRTRA